MSWDEALRLTRLLAGDPSSQVAAALAGWSGPRSQEWFLLADLFDLLHRVNSSRKPQPYPRPGDQARKRIGGTKRPQHEVRAALAARGPAAPAHKRDARGRLHDHRGKFVAG